VEVKNQKKLVQMIEKMLADNNLSNMGIQGRKLAEEFFDQEKVVKTHYRIYASILERAKSTKAP
jgi:hypothetical protein